ncbi:hypothetical protein EIP91_007005 [Steccherinum ochraceum]|uniref:FAD-binding PCMH-type domain-containing protein n=1 Tax=Steccherinum ochraceum TaxID=92696 RepID=A0A4R0RQV5_9APHY|nr:hypothetical protein EIP91_007005 [Steccherinum ochraceum]
MSPQDLPRIQTAASELDQTLYDELTSLVRGPVFKRSDTQFYDRSRTFNGKIQLLSKVVVSPLDAKDVSAIVRFCSQHQLSPSVKAGGYGIAGWAVAGDIVVDMSMIKDVDIEAPIPAADGTVVTWTRLKDMPEPGSKGKGRAVASQADASSSANASTYMAQPLQDSTRVSTKRPREQEEVPDNSQPPRPVRGFGYNPWTSFDAASHGTGSFLRGPALPPVDGEVPREPPRNRPRLDTSQQPSSLLHAPPLEKRQSSSGSSSELSSSGSAHTFDSRASFALSTGTADTTPPPQSEKESVSPPAASATATPGGADPFGYISGTTPSRLPVYGGVDPPVPTFSPSSAPGSSSPWSSSGVTASPFGLPGSLSVNATPFALPNLLGMAPGTNASTPAGPIQPVHNHAYVTFGAGVKQKEVDIYAADHPLEGTDIVTGEKKAAAVPYHVPSSAHPVGSSTMILAGFGFISRMYGLSIDNIVEVEMVLSDGRIVIVNKDEDPDLWWAIRGAGPAFGIATRYKVKAYPVPVVFAGNLIYRFHRATAPSLIKHFRDCIKGAPRELYANVLLTAGPADKDSLVVIQMCYVGPKEKGMEYLQAISSWDGERCLLNEVNEKSYLNQQDSVAQVLRGKSGRQWFMRSSLIHSLPDEVVNKTVFAFANTPIGCTWIFELAGGAIADYEDTCLPKEQREAIWTVAALHQWEMGIDDPRCISAAEDWMKDVIGPVSLGGPLPTFLGRHETPERTMASFGKNWPRLADLKRKYDPEGLFKNNFWPLDKDGQPIGELYNEPPSPGPEEM